MKCFLETNSSYKDAKFIVLPVPYEATTTYGQGTKNGPSAILSASQHVEEFDEELGHVTCDKTPVHTFKPVALSHLVPRLSSVLKDRKIPVIFGGEHSITPVAVKAIAKHYKNLSVLQFDAHADLRDKYRGSMNNHACVMRRVLEICPAVQVGIRNISQEGWEFIRRTGQISKIHFVNSKSQAPNNKQYQNIKSKLSKNVYITIDVDVFDPSVVPAVGTPEPGGMLWHEVLGVLKNVCANKNVVGFDVVELSPRKGDITSDFTVAKLVYKLMGYLCLRQ